MHRLVGLVVCVVCACGDDSMDETATASDTSSVDSSSSSSSSSSTSSSSVSDSISVGDSSTANESESETATTGQPQSCGEVTDAATCMTAVDEFMTCLWLPSTTWVGGGDAACESIDVGPTGICAIDEQDDGCDPTAVPSCPDELTSVWYREVGLEVGAIEVIAFPADQICEAPGGGFVQCLYDAQTSTFTPPECSCVCPMGE